MTNIDTAAGQELPTLEEQTSLRRAKLQELRAQGQAYPNDFKPTDHAGDLLEVHHDESTEALEQANIAVSLAGRIMTRRLMGKATFFDLQDMSARIQVYARQQDLPEGLFESFKKWDLGDIVGVEGLVFRTKTGELSVKAKKLCLLTKALHPMPDKFHGLADQEVCYRQRYLDLLVNPETRTRFKIRSQVIQYIRDFLISYKFLEVETPMMQSIPGGAAARPFITHHNALDRDLYLRIAPELYLKRLVVGGFDRVFEINRNFRNEGISTRHNPEFTMVEFYCAYWEYNQLMDLTEALLSGLCQDLYNKKSIEYQGVTIDFGKPFTRMTMAESLLHYHPELKPEDITDPKALVAYAATKQITLDVNKPVGKLQTELFEETVEDQLIQPTFITAYPREVSPLARSNDQNPEITDRFELFIVGRELANGFSELNDPEDQAERFKQQASNLAAGDQEAMHYDADYITALEYGLAPTAGEGIGIDRLVMLMTDSPSIREVILFPHLRDKVK